MPPGEAVVDLGAITANLRIIAATARTELMAVVKADAFGHGAVPVARAAVAAGAGWLGTTSAAEALALRAAGLTAPILSWLHPPDEDFGRLIDAHIDIGVSSLPHLHAVATAARLRGTPAQVQLKADTGLSRNGAVDTDWPELTAWARKYETEGGVRVRALWSHLANDSPHGDDPCRVENTCRVEDTARADGSRRAGVSVSAQVEAFQEAVRVARAAGLEPRLLHLANSAAALHAPRTRFGLCRIGIALYGVGDSGCQGLRPAMTLRSRVINVKRVPAGTGVSYGPDHVTTRPTTLALLPLGFADGLPRAAQGRAAVWLHGQRRKIAGRIAMDQCVIDAGNLPVRIGDPVIVFGEGGNGNDGNRGGRGTRKPSAEEGGTAKRNADTGHAGKSGAGVPGADDWARWAGTNPHEILTGVGARVGRRHHYGEAEECDSL